MGHPPTYAYDDADRLTSVIDAQTPSAGVTSYTYDTENYITDIYGANNNPTHFDYYSIQMRRMSPPITLASTHSTM